MATFNCLTYCSEQVLPSELDSFLKNDPSALEKITSARTSVPLLSYSGDGYFMGDIDESRRKAYLEKFCPEFQLENGSKSFCLQADPYSFRRFRIKADGETYSFRACSPGHPPHEFLFPNLDLFEVKGLLEPPLEGNENVRSFLIHILLQGKGIDFFETPVAIFETISTEERRLYQNQLVIPPYQRVYTTITIKEKECVRLRALTPEFLEEILRCSGRSVQEYVPRVLKQMGNTTKDIVDKDVSLAYRADSTLLRRWFGIEPKIYVDCKTCGGEANLHNFEVDPSTGEVRVVADFSSSLASSKEGDYFFRVKKMGYDPALSLAFSRKRPDQNRELVLGALINLITDITLTPPFLRILQKAGLISEDRLDAHFDAMHRFQDFSLRSKEEYAKRLGHQAGLEYIKAITELAETCKLKTEKYNHRGKCSGQEYIILELQIPEMIRKDFWAPIAFSKFNGSGLDIDAYRRYKQEKSQVWMDKFPEIMRKLVRTAQEDADNYDFKRSKKPKSETAILHDKISRGGIAERIRELVCGD